jgi:hypothetical protein
MWTLLRSSSGYSTLLEQEDEESSKGSLFRKHFLALTFVTNTTRALAIGLDYVVAAWLPGFSVSRIRFLLQTFPSVCYLENQAYFAFYLGHINSEISGSSPMTTFPWVWVQFSVMLLLALLVLVWEKKQAYILHMLFIAATSLLLIMLYTIVSIYGACFHRVSRWQLGKCF